MDYEGAGSHPIMLNLARPFHNNLYFDILNTDILSKSPKTIYVIEDDLISVGIYALHCRRQAGNVRCEAPVPTSATVRTRP